MNLQHFDLRFAAALSLAFIGWSSDYAYGQTFLEKLESAVRERLNDPKQEVTQEELPGPQTTAVVPEPQSKLPSILDKSPAESAGSGVPAGAPPQAVPANPPAARIYLGLDAEGISGGGIGVLVASVTEGSPAWKAGFQPNDRISAINGFAIANLDGMVEQLNKTLPGQTAKFLVSRGGRNFELVAVLMQADLAQQIAGGPLLLGPTASPPEMNGPAWLGVLVNDLTPPFRAQFGTSVFRGAAVTNVTPNSPAAKAGILAGDTIIAIGPTTIDTARDLMAWMSAARPGQTTEVTYQRGIFTRQATLTLEVNPGTTEPRSAGRATVPNEASSASQEVAALQQEVSRLRLELQQASQRLELTQNRLQQVLNGLGKEE